MSFTHHCTLFLFTFFQCFWNWGCKFLQYYLCCIVLYCKYMAKLVAIYSYVIILLQHIRQMQLSRS